MKTTKEELDKKSKAHQKALRLSESVSSFSDMDKESEIEQLKKIADDNSREAEEERKKLKKKDEEIEALKEQIKEVERKASATVPFLELVKKRSATTLDVEAME